MVNSIRRGDIAFWTAAAFLFGIFAASSGWNIKIVAIFFGVILTAAFFILKDRGLGKYAVIVFFAIAAGVIYYFVYIRWSASHTHVPSAKESAFFGLVADEPKQAGNFMMFPLVLSKPYSGTIDVFASSRSQFHYGDLLWLRGNVAASKDSDEYPTIFLPQMKTISSGGGFWLKNWSVRAKSFISQKFVELFSADNAALLSAIILGGNGTLGVALKQQMDASGTSYIVGMYGYKIAIIGAALLGLLKNYVPRKILLPSVLSAIWLFIFVSGGSISAIRAGIMGSLALVATALGRMASARNALTFTACVIALFNPGILVDAAFQLSFLSFLGIYYLGPPIENFFHWTDGGWLQWKEHAMLSLATNLAIVPVIMATFGDFSLTSFISNILIMIPWSVVILLGIIAAALGTMLPALAFFVIQLTNMLLSYEFFIIRMFALYVVPLPNIFASNFVLVGYYGLLIIFIYYYGEEA